MNDLEKQLDEAMLAVYQRAKEECGYNATAFFNMLNQRKGLGTARALLASSDGVQYGFTRLWELGRLDITMECTVLNPKFQPLFSEDELGEARRRLKKYGFDLAKQKH